MPWRSMGLVDVAESSDNVTIAGLPTDLDTDMSTPATTQDSNRTFRRCISEINTVSTMAPTAHGYTGPNTCVDIPVPVFDLLVSEADASSETESADRREKPSKRSRSDFEAEHVDSNASNQNQLSVKSQRTICKSSSAPASLNQLGNQTGASGRGGLVQSIPQIAKNTGIYPAVSGHETGPDTRHIDHHLHALVELPQIENSTDLLASQDSSVLQGDQDSHEFLTKLATGSIIDDHIPPINLDENESLIPTENGLSRAIGDTCRPMSDENISRTSCQFENLSVSPATALIHPQSPPVIVRNSGTHTQISTQNKHYNRTDDGKKEIAANASDIEIALSNEPDTETKKPNFEPIAEEDLSVVSRLSHSASFVDPSDLDLDFLCESFPEASEATSVTCMGTPSLDLTSPLGHLELDFHIDDPFYSEPIDNLHEYIGSEDEEAACDEDIQPSSAIPSVVHTATERHDASHPKKKTGLCPHTYQRGQLWKFLLESLCQKDYNPCYITWEDEDAGVFRIVCRENITRLWAQRRGKDDMHYDIMARAIRHYYAKKVILPIRRRNLKMTFRFGPNAKGWKKLVQVYSDISML